MKGYVYLINRDNQSIKILCQCDIEQLQKNPEINKIISDKKTINQVEKEIYQNRMKWQSYAEPGDIETILSNCKKRGFSFKTGKYHPTINKSQNDRKVSKKFVFKNNH